MGENSVFSTGWIASGPKQLWDVSATYDVVALDLLPTLPAHLFDGSFRWLLAQPQPRSGLDYSAEEPDNHGLEVLPRLRAEAESLGLRIPAEFERFVSDPALHRRVLSPTLCYLGFSPDLVEDPSGRGGRMLRFLNDSQGSAFWYLYLSPNAEGTVLGSGEWHYSYRIPDEPLDPSRYLWSGPDFESFIYRLWIEGLIFEHVFRNQPLTAELRAYVAAAQARARARAGPTRRQ